MPKYRVIIETENSKEERRAAFWHREARHTDSAERWQLREYIANIPAVCGMPHYAAVCAARGYFESTGRATRFVDSCRAVE